MSNTNVIGLHRNEELIATLEQLLSEAKTGRLESLNAVVQRDGKIDFEIDYSQLGQVEVVGGLEMLKAVILNSVLLGDEDE